MPNWTDIADADALPEGGRLCLKLQDQPLLVLNVAGNIYAIENVCPHAGRPLEEGEVRGKTITCPYHGYAYNLATGASLDQPDIEPPVRTYAVRVQGEKLQIDAEVDAH